MQVILTREMDYAEVCCDGTEDVIGKLIDNGVTGTEFDEYVASLYPNGIEEDELYYILCFNDGGGRETLIHFGINPDN